MMRVLKLALLMLMAMAGALLLVANWTPTAEYSAAAAGYGLGDLQRLSQDLRIERIQIRTDPLGLGEDLLPTFAIAAPVLMMVLLALGLIAGALLAQIAARGSRRELREKRDEVLLLKAELHKAQALLKASDHPASVLPVARRR
ncbi:MAG: hypothetical protein AAGM38_08885 [Pseudomonadota bacterium]